jgi:branched-chain amino acid transport system permease protein
MAPIIGGVALLVAAVLPFVPVTVPFLFGGPLSSPGTLHLVATMLVFGALAMTYDLLFGFTGLLSFGHALYFGVGVYGTAIATTTFDLGLGGAVLLVAVAGLVLPTVLGAICLRVRDIAFAMVTLAFAQAGAIFVMRDPLGVTGGELGTSVNFAQLPEALAGVVNTRNVYWVALALAVVVFTVGRVTVTSRVGRVWQAIRENEQRVEVLGLRPASFKLLVFVLASFLASLCGVVYVLLVGGAHPSVTVATFTLTLLVMVVVGGAGTLWGALIGGMLYAYAQDRLGDLSSSAALADAPAIVRVPLSEPLFLLGLLFVVLVLFFPGGIAGAFSGTRTRGGGLRARLAGLRRGGAAPARAIGAPDGAPTPPTPAPPTEDATEDDDRRSTDAEVTGR